MSSFDEEGIAMSSFDDEGFDTTKMPPPNAQAAPKAQAAQRQQSKRKQEGRSGNTCQEDESSKSCFHVTCQLPKKAKKKWCEMHNRIFQAMEYQAKGNDDPSCMETLNAVMNDPVTAAREMDLFSEENPAGGALPAEEVHRLDTVRARVRFQAREQPQGFRQALHGTWIQGLVRKQRPHRSGCLELVGGGSSSSSGTCGPTTKGGMKTVAPVAFASGSRMPTSRATESPP